MKMKNFKLNRTYQNSKACRTFYKRSGKSNAFRTDSLDVSDSVTQVKPHVFKFKNKSYTLTTSKRAVQYKSKKRLSLYKKHFLSRQKTSGSTGKIIDVARRSARRLRNTYREGDSQTIQESIHTQATLPLQAIKKQAIKKVNSKFTLRKQYQRNLLSKRSPISKRASFLRFNRTNNIGNNAQKLAIKKAYQRAAFSKVNANKLSLKISFERMISGATSEAKKLLTVVLQPKKYLIIGGAILALLSTIFFSFFIGTSSTTSLYSYNWEIEELTRIDQRFSEKEVDYYLDLQSKYQAYKNNSHARIQFDPVGHDSHELLAFMSVWSNKISPKEKLSEDEVNELIDKLFDMRYDYKEQRTIEQVTVTETDADGKKVTRTEMIEKISLVSKTLSFDRIIKKYFSKNTAPISGNDFIDAIAPSAVKVASEHDLYASVIIAQALLESDSGRSALSQAPDHNLFGVKGEYNGQYSLWDTYEDDGSGNLYMIKAKFRQYNDYEETFEDFANVMNNGYYTNVFKSKAPTYQDATRALTGVYATDTLYNTKLNRIIEEYNLTKYDNTAVERSTKKEVANHADVMPGKFTTDDWNTSIRNFPINAEDPPYVTGNFVNKFLERYPNSRLRGYGDLIVSLCNEYGINVGVFLGQIAKETTFGTNPCGGEYNFGCVIWTETSQYPKIWTGDRYWINPPSVEEGIRATLKTYAWYVDEGWISYGEALDKYSPSFENNQSEFMSLMYGMIVNVIGQDINDVTQAKIPGSSGGSGSWFTEEELELFKEKYENKGLLTTVKSPIDGVDPIDALKAPYGAYIENNTKLISERAVFETEAGKNVVAILSSKVHAIDGNSITLEYSNGAHIVYEGINVQVAVEQKIERNSIIGQTVGGELSIAIKGEKSSINPLLLFDSESPIELIYYIQSKHSVGRSSFKRGRKFTDKEVQELIAYSEQWLGMPYVYGGSTPETSFDCSGFVVWNFTQTGFKHMERLTAQGIYDTYCEPISKEEAVPGDLVFFEDTYPFYERITHIGIYVGNGEMIHAGDPIQYIHIDSSWYAGKNPSYGRVIR
ncbi:glucosaminidase domain-containing protein [Aerococcaceae bacterium NML191292]|nr:glucosaminidase domain-containing protein [Aerococcaceae bacterium NML191292]